MRIGLHVKYPLFLLDFNETWIFLTDSFRMILKYRHGNPLSGNRVVPSGRAYGQTGRHDELTAALRNFAKFSKNHRIFKENVS